MIKFENGLRLTGQYSLLPGVIRVQWKKAEAYKWIHKEPRKIFLFGKHIWTWEYSCFDGDWKIVELKEGDKEYPANPYIVPYEKLDQIFED